MKKILILSLFVAVISSCGSMRSVATGESISIEGKITKMGMTTYQYGTHSINYAGKPFALRSSSLNLDTYVDKQVVLKGTKVSGYPLEGRPELIEVSEVVMK
ncbi:MULTISPECIES: hypothetical protein [Pedobacter]|uniref:hypothetical protein n=1 Tax=Pedobacter TaxID=84567 RepID=UPI001214D2D7|nr:MULTISPECIES: hypothetical protein [Pedobacter]RZL69097.1 MAG: hypothetical protein EOO93_02535 [Pedobacter sp.]